MSRAAVAVAIVLSAAVLSSSALVIFETVLAVPDAKANGSLAKIPLFEFEQQAQLHCPDDAIVWATASMGIYNSSTERWYGRTSSGAYGCLREVANAGYRAQRVGR
jgi:hypothetical protein